MYHKNRVVQCGATWLEEMGWVGGWVVAVQICYTRSYWYIAMSEALAKIQHQSQGDNVGARVGQVLKDQVSPVCCSRGGASQAAEAGTCKPEAYGPLPHGLLAGSARAPLHRLSLLPLRPGQELYNRSVYKQIPPWRQHHWC